MKLLKNKSAWKRFMLNEVCGVTKWNIGDQSEPAEYPCFAYAVVQSFGYEEEQPRYLYARDLKRMLRKFPATNGTATPTDAGGQQ